MNRIVLLCLALSLTACAQDGLCVRNLITGTCEAPTPNLQCQKGKGYLNKHGQVVCPK